MLHSPQTIKSDQPLRFETDQISHFLIEKNEIGFKLNLTSFQVLVPIKTYTNVEGKT
jgi:hypothetical protein